MQTGEYEFLKYKDGMISFMRRNQIERTMVALNFSEDVRPLYIGEKNVSLLLSNKREAIVNGATLDVLPNEAIILKEDSI